MRSVWVKKTKAITALLAVLTVCTLSAQTWVKANVQDPMNSKTFVGFGLRGTLLSESVSQEGLPEIDIFCSKGKIMYGLLLNHGFGHELAYRQILNAGKLATPMGVRFNEDKQSWVFSSPHELDNLASAKLYSTKEIKKILDSHTVTFQAWDGYQVTHYMQFTIPPKSPALQEACFKSE
jgi:hypothetical protein